MILETHGAGFYDTPKDKGLYQVEINLFRKWDQQKKHNTPINNFLNSYQRVLNGKKSKSISRSRSKSSGKKTKKVSRLGNHYTLYQNNTNIVNILTKIKSYYQLIGDKIHVIAYQKAIYQLKRYPYNIDSGNQVGSFRWYWKRYGY